jgi:hypothetical protein
MIRRFDALTGTRIGKPLRDHDGWVRAITTYPTANGHVLVTGGDDGYVRRWDANTGGLIGTPLPAHGDLGVSALAAYTTKDGHQGLATGGYDGLVRRWDIQRGVPIGGPLTDHRGGVLAIATYATADGPVIASAGWDGTVRLWDATTGRQLRRVSVEPIQLRGLADRRAVRDLLGRTALTDELAELLNWKAAPDTEPGPNVVTIEGPWGCGKSSIMDLVLRKIVMVPPPPRAPHVLSVRAARRLLRDHNPPRPALRPDRVDRGAVTAWFNPWTHQSSAQVWAGLTHAIIQAAQPVLFPDTDSEHRYWFLRNIAHIDRHAARRRLGWRTISPLFGLAVTGLLATVLLKVSDLHQSVLLTAGSIRLTPGLAAAVLGGALLTVALMHTTVRYLGRAAALLPAEIVRGPIRGRHLDDAASPGSARRDPFYEATSGYLYLVQHDVADIVADLRDAGYDLVVFIDDLDRCGHAATAEVFEAVNLFLSGTSPLQAKFVIGLDPTVVAAHLDVLYKEMTRASLGLHADDPTPGWAFLRKVVQLPVRVPQVADEDVERFLSQIMPEHLAAPRSSVTPQPGAKPGTARSTAAPIDHMPTIAAYDAFGIRPSARREGPIERQPEVLGLIEQRILAQHQRSAREAKRLLNVWQLYQRLLYRTAPMRDDDALVLRACRLLILAEIITRWPALQGQLHMPIQGRRGLQMLAAAADDDTRWSEAIAIVGLTRPDSGETGPHDRALVDLRSLLSAYDGPSIADLAATVL